MKKVIILAAAAIFASVAVYAQDLEGATDMLNSGVSASEEGDNVTALECFQNALTMAEFCGADGADIVANCKKAIPTLLIKIGKKENNDKNYDEAISYYEQALKAAEEYGDDEVKAEAEAELPNLRVRKAGLLFQGKNYEEAIPVYMDILEDSPEDGASWLRLGACCTATGKVNEAIDAFKNAYQYGETDAAAKQLSTLYLRLAQANLKANKYAETIANCVESNAYVENGNAYKLAASAAVKLQRNTEAIGYYEKYLEISPNAQDASGIILTVAVLYQQGGNKAKALEYYKQIENDPKYKEQAQAGIKACGN